MKKKVEELTYDEGVMAKARVLIHQHKKYLNQVGSKVTVPSVHGVSKEDQEFLRRHLGDEVEV